VLNTDSAALVTGGAGFIGAALVGRLRTLGIPVTVLDRLPLEDAHRLARFASEEGVTYHAVALEDAARLERIVGGHSTVFHLAANTENRADRAEVDADVTQTVAGTTALLRALAAGPETTIVLASSQLVYAPGSADEPITEETASLAPPTPFAAGKVAAEAFLHAHCSEHGHRGVVCRFANIVGPGMGRGIVHDLTAAVRAGDHLHVLGDGRQTRSYLHVEDCAAALIAAATAGEDDAVCNVYNVCNEDEISAATVAGIVAEEVDGERPAIRFGGGERGWRGDVPTLRLRARALRGLGWRPAMDSAEAVRLTARALLAAPPEPPRPVAPEPVPVAERWEVLNSRSLYESKWVGLSLVKVRPPGREPYDHHVVSLPPAVGVVVGCPRRGILLLHRHRFITDSAGFEVPAGGIDPHESVEAAAEREVLEETGWRLRGVERLVSCNVSDGVSDQRFHLVLARPGRHSGPPVDAHEATSQAWFRPGRVRGLIREGEVPGALSIVALLYALSYDRV
jgi:UDP-glucose 4-epimerase